MLLAIDKPIGITSYDVIRALKSVFVGQKIGHSGTLDPMASGLLIVGLDSDTKNLGIIQGKNKRYTTSIDFSKKSDTWDMDYREYYEEIKISKDPPSLQLINNILEKLPPSYDLPLTPFSAKKKNGKKLYELARQGHQEITYKNMIINSFDIISYVFPELELRLDVGSGTYIRSIGYWIGQQLGLGGILTKLRRESIGNLNISILSESQNIIYKDKTILFKQIDLNNI